MAGTYIPAVPSQYFLNDGTVANGAQLFTYSAGTTTKLATYSDQALSSANANPIVLDSAGRATIFLAKASYKFVLAPSTDTDPPASPIWTRDNIGQTSDRTDTDITGTAGETLAAGEWVYCSDGTGGRTTGRWYLTDSDTAAYSTTAPAIGVATEAITSGADGSIRVAGQALSQTGLTAGTTYYLGSTAGAITSTAPGHSRAVGIADSTTSVIMLNTSGANDTTGPLPIVWDAVFANTGNVGGGADTLYSYSLPAGTFVTNGDVIEGVFWGTTANNNNPKTLIIRADDASTDTAIYSMALTVSEAGYWVAKCGVIRRSAATALSWANAQVGPTNAAATASMQNTMASFSVDWTVAVEIRVTGTVTDGGGGINDDDIILQGGYCRPLTLAP
jgi:hypothetical protein